MSLSCKIVQVHIFATHVGICATHGANCSYRHPAVTAPLIVTATRSKVSTWHCQVKSNMEDPGIGQVNLEVKDGQFWHLSGKEGSQFVDEWHFKWSNQSKPYTLKNYWCQWYGHIANKKSNWFAFAEDFQIMMTGRQKLNSYLITILFLVFLGTILIYKGYMFDSEKVNYLKKKHLGLGRRWIQLWPKSHLGGRSAFERQRTISEICKKGKI